jgi:hypothetical protein
MSGNRAFPGRAVMPSAVSLQRRRGPVRTHQRRDSPRLHAMPAGLAMRDHELEVVIDNLQL